MKPRNCKKRSQEAVSTNSLQSSSRTTATHAGSLLLCSPRRCVKRARLTDPGHLSCAEFEGVDCLQALSGSSCRRKPRRRVLGSGEWMACLSAHSVTRLQPVSCGARFPLHPGCEFREGRHSCDWDCRSAFSKRARKTLTLCELRCEGKWSCFGQRVFEAVVKPAQLFLVHCVESLILGCERFGGGCSGAQVGRDLGW